MRCTTDNYWLPFTCVCVRARTSWPAKVCEFVHCVIIWFWWNNWFPSFFSHFLFFFIYLQLTFKCSGSSHPPPSTLDSHVDPHTGVQLQEVTATISKDLVFEYFGKSPFKCDCHAWSPRGKAKSQSATVEVACKFFIPFIDFIHLLFVVII